MKSKRFKVTNNRIQFKCHSCGTKRNMTVPLNSRNKNIKCQKCTEITKCVFDRRQGNRSSQAGKVVMTTQNGKNHEVMLHDISPNGLGIDIPLRIFRSCKVRSGEKIRLNCNWNPFLLRSNAFIVKCITNQRIGLSKI